MGNVVHWQNLVEQHIDLVRQTAQRMKATVPSIVEIDDLIGAGYLGLCKAAKLYRAARGASFATYATKRVWGSMVDWLRKMDHIPRVTRIRAKRDGTDHMLPTVVHLYTRSDRRATFGEPDDNAGLLVSILPARNGCPVTHASNREWPAVFHGLSATQRTIIELKYRMGLTMSQIGMKLGLSKGRISQIHTHVLKIWKEWLEQKAVAER
jgi:RNA polymerase sigma factor (sigma-70 family)